MNKIGSWLKKRTLTEFFLIGTAIILVILIIMRWDIVSKEISESFSNMFSPRQPLGTE
ncbi:MAG: hypothetical protein WC951_09160 [Bacteroidales bacterium]|nr:hypothetical protein [Tenuifilaceae bacterium]